MKDAKSEEYAIPQKVVNHVSETDSAAHIINNAVFRTLSGFGLKGEADRRIAIKKSFLPMLLALVMLLHFNSRR